MTKSKSFKETELHKSAQVMRMKIRSSLHAYDLRPNEPMARDLIIVGLILFLTNENVNSRVRLKALGMLNSHIGDRDTLSLIFQRAMMFEKGPAIVGKLAYDSGHWGDRWSLGRFRTQTVEFTSLLAQSF